MQRKRGNKNKKAVSQIVTTILIILLVLAAIVIVWNVVKKTITEGSEDVGVEKFSVSLSTSKVNLSEDPISVPVTRNAGAGNIISIKIVFENNAGESYIYENLTNIPDELETIVYSIPRSDIDLSGILVSFEVYPIVLVAGKNVTGLKASGGGEIIEEGTLGGPGCSEDCSPEDSTQCVGNINQTCGNYDADSCLEWGNNYSCSDCSCSCGGYNTAESLSNNNCQDTLDNDCDTKIDGDEVECMPSNLILWLRFEGDAYDELGIYNGDILGNTNCTSAGKNGFGCYFDGNGDYISLPTSGLPYGLSNRTMCIWAKTDTITSGYRWAIAYGRPQPPACGQSFFIGMKSGAILDVGGYCPAYDLTATNYWVVGVWNHICLVYDGTTGRVYSNSNYINSSVIIWNTVENVTRIGRQTNNNAEYWNGSVDDAMIFNRALSADEIQSIYNYQE